MAEVAALPALVSEDWDWQVNAACRGVGVDLFFNPDSERGKSKRDRDANAKAVCATCPVIAQCLSWAMSVDEPYGVWGGLTTNERHALRNDRRGLAIAN
jgi:WhiB family transcriptional regulator, redox-sensing transcriptional regulator